MRCPFCQNENTRVLESRQEDSINAIRRRRICDECDKRFTTHEKIDVIPLTIIKKDGTRVEYDRGKIEAGILRSCHKRPISIDAITQLVDSVEARIFESDKKEIPSRDIGEWVMENLKHLDPVAYVRFASVYREFKDAPTFMDELAKLLGHEMEET